MYFCPECSYSFDITKSSGQSNIKDTRKKVDKLNDALKIFDTKEDMTKYVAGFKIEETQKNKKYQKLTDNEKAKFNQIFDDLSLTGAEFKCNNCNHIEPITKTILLYKLDLEEKSSKFKSLEENEFICKDPILPRTHDYTCKNPNCITHKDNKQKEAVFVKDKNTFKVTYICCVCYYSW